LQQTTRVHQSDAVNKTQPHLAPLGTDLTDCPFDSATGLGTVIRQAVPQNGLLGVRYGATNHRPQRRDELLGIRVQGVKKRIQVCLLHTNPLDKRLDTVPYGQESGGVRASAMLALDVASKAEEAEKAKQATEARETRQTKQTLAAGNEPEETETPEEPEEAQPTK
jgi:hypothetical protein